MISMLHSAAVSAACPIMWVISSSVVPSGSITASRIPIGSIPFEAISFADICMQSLPMSFTDAVIGSVDITHSYSPKSIAAQSSPTPACTSTSGLLHFILLITAFESSALSNFPTFSMLLFSYLSKGPEYFSYPGPGCGGDGESRTRVRKHFHRTFSERSQCFKISPPWPPINMLPCQLSRCSLRGTENSLQVFPYSRRRYHSLRVSCGRRASRLRRCRTMLLMRNCCYF